MNWLHESKLTLKLAIPLMIGQLSQMLLGVADTIMVGHLGVTELAALTFANALFHIPFVFGIGLLTGISVFTSNAKGANLPEDVKNSCRHGLFLSLFMGLVLFVGAIFLSLHLETFGQPADVCAKTTIYFRIIMASMVPALASIALKNHADALNRPWPPFWIFLGGVVLNIFLNWVMIHGKLGFPKLGFEGAAWATLVSRILIFAAIAWWLTTHKELSKWVPHQWFQPLHIQPLKRLLSVGFPASLQMLCEVSAFSVAGLMMGYLGANAMAAHQIAITLAGTAFMIPLGLSMALTVRMGEAYGNREASHLRQIAYSGWVLVTLCAACSATLFLGLGSLMSGFFTHAEEVIELSAKLLIIVGVFQWVDGLQVASAAMLRGLNDARIPALMGFVAYWIVGLPLSYGLAFHSSLAAEGIWWGLAAGLGFASVALCPRLWGFTKHAPVTK